MMFTPRKKPKYSTPVKNGLFTDGVWHCNCEPPLPASHFQVRKEGANKGRWFYTCQEQKETACGFFLWGDEASGREMGAVLSNSRSEPGARKAVDDTERDKTPRTTLEKYAKVKVNWSLDLDKKDEDEFGDWTLSVDDEIQLAQTAENYTFQEPLRKFATSDSPSTPRNKRKREEAESWPTPRTGTSKDYVHEAATYGTASSSKVMKDNIWETSALMSPGATPTPIRFHDIGTTEASKTDSDYDITQEVLDLLKDNDLSIELKSQLRKVLNRHALKAQGTAKGRDITRLAVKSKDAKIAELQQRIVALETERSMDKVVIQHFKSDMADSVSRRRGARGRGKP